jgi:hypothetical protein
VVDNGYEPRKRRPKGRRFQVKESVRYRLLSSPAVTTIVTTYGAAGGEVLGGAVAHDRARQAVRGSEEIVTPSQVRSALHAPKLAGS